MKSNKTLFSDSVPKELDAVTQKFPEQIFIVTYPQINAGYIYNKSYVHKNGGCYYVSASNINPVIGEFISLYPDGHLTYLWNDKEKPFDYKWYIVG